jgi:hypothetical protein
LFVGFEDLNRKDYGDFTAGDFSCSVTVSSEMLVLNVKPGNDMNSFGYDLDDAHSHTHHVTDGSTALCWALTAFSGS